MMKPISVYSLYLLVIILLAGCGSGGGSTPSTVNAVPGDGVATAGTASTGETASTGAASTGGAAVLLTWDPPTEPYAGIKVYYGTSPGNYTSTINAGMVSSYTVKGLASGTYHFALTAFDSSGNESDYSSIVTMTIM